MYTVATKEIVSQLCGWDITLNKVWLCDYSSRDFRSMKFPFIAIAFRVQFDPEW